MYFTVSKHIMFGHHCCFCVVDLRFWDLLLNTRKSRMYCRAAFSNSSISSCMGSPRADIHTKMSPQRVDMKELSLKIIHGPI